MKMVMVLLILVSFLFSTPVVVSQLQSTPPAAQLYKFTVTDLAPASPKLGAFRYRTDLGPEFIIEAMKEAAEYIFQVFNQPNIEDRKHEVGTEVHMDVHDFIQGAVGFYTQIDEKHQLIAITSAFMETLPPLILKYRVRGLIYHEMTHVWQWYGNVTTPNPPAWLFEGIADYVAYSAGLQVFAWPSPGAGNRWDEGYIVTALFLAYCNDLKPGFVGSLNKLLKYNYNNRYFEVLLGKPIDVLWTDYKNKYGQKSFEEISQIMFKQNY